MKRIYSRMEIDDMAEGDFIPGDAMNILSGAGYKQIEGRNGTAVYRSPGLDRWVVLTDASEKAGEPGFMVAEILDRNHPAIKGVPDHPIYRNVKYFTTRGISSCRISLRPCPCHT